MEETDEKGQVEQEKSVMRDKNCEEEKCRYFKVKIARNIERNIFIIFLSDRKVK